MDTEGDAKSGYAPHIADQHATPRRRPLVLAHRGASAHAPDNSVEAFALARDQGADGIEFDVRFTLDGAVVLHHDATVPGLGPVIEHTLAEFRKHIRSAATLEEILEHTGDMLLNVEIKNHPRDPDFDPGHRMADVVTKWIEHNDLRTRSLVSSFNPETVAKVRRLDDRIDTGLLLEHGRGFTEELHAARAAGHAWLLPRRSVFRIAPGRLVAAAHEEGMRLGTWTVDRPQELRRLRTAGIDAVITNDPKRALEVYV